jgi:cell fate (sporulation/competence/biofilm development) regulator YmcA (YheA/YmcA/DUF963 family)
MNETIEETVVKLQRALNSKIEEFKRLEVRLSAYQEIFEAMDKVRQRLKEERAVRLEL